MIFVIFAVTERPQFDKRSTVTFQPSKLVFGSLSTCRQCHVATAAPTNCRERTKNTLSDGQLAGPRRLCLRLDRKLLNRIYSRAEIATPIGFTILDSGKAFGNYGP